MDAQLASLSQQNPLCSKLQMGLFDFKPLITVVLGDAESLTLRWHLSKTNGVEFEGNRMEPSKKNVKSQSDNNP